MRFAKFWAKGSYNGVSCWGWSDRSPTEAEHAALRTAESLAARIRLNEPRTKSYDYAERPLREEIIESIDDTAIVSRNSYGCLVVNTSTVVFVDVDEEPRVSKGVSKGLLSGIISLFSKKNEAATTEAELEFLAKVNSFIAQHPRWGIRAYKTAAGFRLLISHREFSPEDAEVSALFEFFKCDPCYQKLCAQQQSFRARLTPKPWRCGLERPAVRWPFTIASESEKFSAWLKQYEEQTRSYATCRLLGQFGSTQMPRSVLNVCGRHDRATQAESGMPLA